MQSQDQELVEAQPRLSTVIFSVTVFASLDFRAECFRGTLWVGGAAQTLDGVAPLLLAPDARNPTVSSLRVQTLHMLRFTK